MIKLAKLMTVAMLLAASTALGQADAAKDKQPQKETQVEAKKLVIGDRAPELAIQTWVKGEPITGFEKGRVYVVEFWATWCGPCIAGMPHVTELQKEYKDKGVTVIGVNIWDDPSNVEPFMKDRGDNPNGDELMGYTVAIEKAKDPANPRKTGVMAETWMKAAGRNGIPSAFIVDQKGTIAWMGHPMRMDEPLKQVVAGTWDPKKAAELERAEAEQQAKARAEMAKVNAKMNEYRTLLSEGETAAAARIGRELVDGPGKANPMILNQVAWFMVDPAGNVENKDLALAMDAATQACELTKYKEGSILDTLALVYFLKGDVNKAIELQEQAVANVPEGEMKTELEGRLAEFKAAKK